MKVTQNRKNYFSRALFRATAAAAIVSLVAGPASAQILSEIVRKSDVAPDGTSFYRTLDRPSVGDSPTEPVGFVSKVKSVVAGGTRGVFTEGPLGGNVIVFQDDPTPTIPPVRFRRFSRPSINVLGTVAFFARASSSARGIYQTGPLPVTLIGDVPPGGVTGFAGDFGDPALTDGQGAIFRVGLSQFATVATAGGIVALDQIIMRCVGGDMNCTSGTGVAELLITKNDPVPDRPGRFLCDLPEKLGASDYGITFRGATKLDCGDLAESPAYGIFRMAFGGPIETVAFEGEDAEPVPTGGTFYGDLPGLPKIEAGGIVSFLGRTSGVLNETIVYSCDPATCPANVADAVVRAGDDGSGNNVVISRFAAVDISNSGDIVFQARVSQPDSPTGIKNGKGIYIYRSASGGVERVAVKGDAAPDSGGFAAVFRRVFLPDISPNGRVSFRARSKRLTGGPSVTAVYLYE